MKKYIIAIGLLAASTSYLAAQETLTLEDAIAIALENNFDIQLTNLQVEQAELNTNVLNSGYLPSVAANGNLGYANNNSSLTNQAGDVTNINGVENKSYNSSIGINYVLFNGGARKYNYEVLHEAYELAVAQKKTQIENTLIDVYTTYFMVARSQETQKTLERAFEISKERRARVEVQKAYGQRTTLDVLNAQVDANSDSINLVNAGVQLDNAMRTLNVLMGRNLTETFKTDIKITFQDPLSYPELLENLRSGNSQLRQMEINKSISQLNVRMAKSGWMPTVTSSVGYGINYNNNGPAGFFAEQQSQGINGSIGLTWNIFDGGQTRMKVQQAELALRNQQVNASKLQLNLEQQLANFWTTYTTQRTIIQNEERNVTVSEENFLKTKELFALGKVTSLDFRQAQVNLINTKLNLLQAQFDYKLAELQLKKLAGLLAQ